MRVFLKILLAACILLACLLPTRNLVCQDSNAWKNLEKKEYWQNFSRTKSGDLMVFDMAPVRTALEKSNLNIPVNIIYVSPDQFTYDLGTYTTGGENTETDPNAIKARKSYKKARKAYKVARQAVAKKPAKTTGKKDKPTPVSGMPESIKAAPGDPYKSLSALKAGRTRFSRRRASRKAGISPEKEELLLFKDTSGKIRAVIKLKSVPNTRSSKN